MVMGFFKSSRSHLEEIQEHCDRIVELARSVRQASDRSLRGKYEYMRPEERANLVKEAHLFYEKLHTLMQAAKARQSAMEDDQCAKEDILAAESVLLSASLDAAGAHAALDEAHASLVQGISQVEEFYGLKSREAKHLRKVLSQFQVSA